MYKRIKLINYKDLENKYEFSLDHAIAGNYDMVVRNARSLNCVKPSKNSTVLLYSDTGKSKRFGIHWIILVNYKPEQVPEDILERKWYVLHKDKNFQNHSPENLYWSKTPKRKTSHTTGKQTITEDGSLYTSYLKAKKTGQQCQEIRYTLEEGEHFIKTDIFNILARETNFFKFKRVKVTNRGRILMHDGRLTKGSAQYSGKRLLNKYRTVFIGGKTYKVHRLIVMAKLNRILKSTEKIQFKNSNTLDEQGLQRNWLNDMDIIE